MSSVTLSSTDLARLNGAARVLLSPFSFESGATWREEACHAIEALIGATRSVSVVPLEGDDFWGGDSEAIRAFTTHWPPPQWIFRAHLERRAALRLDVADWTEIFDTTAVRASDFYEAVVRPTNLWAPLSIYSDLAELQPSRLWGFQPSEGREWTLAFLTFYFQDEASALRVLEWRKALLQLLVPAVHSGMRAFVHARRLGPRLGQLIDQMNVPIAIYRSGRSIEHQNAALTTLLSDDSEREVIRQAVRRSAGSLAATLAGSRKANSKSLIEIARTDVRTRQAVYCLYATIIEAGTYGWPDLVLVLVERRSSDSVRHHVASRRQLTLREAEALELLRHGASTRHIAAKMGISINTARRHIEHALTKLGARSRIEAMALLTRCDD